MAEDIVKQIALLRDRMKGAQQENIELHEERRRHAVKAADGDPKAKEAIATVDAELAELSSKLETLDIALEELEKTKLQQEAKQAADEHAVRKERAREISEAVLEIDRAIDKAISHLLQLLAERWQLIGQLAALDVVYPGMIKALQRKRSVMGAMLHAGLQRFVKFEVVGPDARKPLEEADRSLRRPLLSKAEQPPLMNGTISKGEAA